MINESHSTNAKNPKESSLSLCIRKFIYNFLRLVARILTTLWFRLRVEGRQHLPKTGAAMFLSTHQSAMDPVLVGLACNRSMNYLARHTLFRNPAFTYLIKVLNAIEIDRERGGLAGLREMLSRLKRGEIVMLFPEGTRTNDGSIGPLKPGFLPIAKRSEVPLIPVAIVGAYECNPKGSKWLVPKPISVVFGKPILAEEYGKWSDPEIMEYLARVLADLHQQGKNRIEAMQ